ncbi:MAG: acetyl-CoA carboxylase, carboxyltransferase subunit beta, partial [Simkaniaceae bacterium]|nr:acetyl-CoA carboxylase, carboxyltransferase subunit beta [Simkaniaceae bacterium]
YHYPLSAPERIRLLTDKGSFTELFAEIASSDPFRFVDSEPYVERLKRARKGTGLREATVVGTATIEERAIAFAVSDFRFMGGSMGSVTGEKITLLIEHAIKHGLPLVIVSSSGGARMQESTLSLMQMAKTSSALARLHRARLPYISVLAHPVTGGVTASFASLGDVIIAEPKALIGFAGPRVVEQTIGQKLPDSAQKAEFLLEKGMIDGVVRRADMKNKLAFFLRMLAGERRRPGKPGKAPLEDVLAVAGKKGAKSGMQVVAK